MDNPKPKGRGCLFWGGIIAGVLLLIGVLLLYAGYRFVHGLVDEYTDTKPIEMPEVRLSAAEIKNLRGRIDAFNTAIQTNKPVGPLVLTAEEINALIAEITKTNPVPVRLFFSFNDDRVQAQLSVPTDSIGLSMLHGRYFNGSGDFNVYLRDSKLVVSVQSLSVKGKPLPEQFMQPLRTNNFADSWTNDPNFNRGLTKLREIKIESGKLFVIPETNHADTASEPAPASKLEMGK
jgi:hypothetical protein